MNAQEARELSKNNLRNIVIDKYVFEVDIIIKNAAEKGQTAIRNPGYSNSLNKSMFLSTDEREELYKYYTSKGFVIKEHDNTDPGHPCSAGYTTLSW